VRPTQLRLPWQWAFVFTDGAPVTAAPRLTWHHTEFGRRSDDLRFHIVTRAGGGWELLEGDDWILVAVAPDLPRAQQLAQQRAAREHHAARRAEIGAT